jgi:hypothetical protein
MHVGVETLNLLSDWRARFFASPPVHNGDDEPIE